MSAGRELPDSRHHGCETGVGADTVGLLFVLPLSPSLATLPVLDQHSKMKAFFYVIISLPLVYEQGAGGLILSRFILANHTVILKDL